MARLVSVVPRNLAGDQIVTISVGQQRLPEVVQLVVEGQRWIVGMQIAVQSQQVKQIVRLCGSQRDLKLSRQSRSFMACPDPSKTTQPNRSGT